MSGAASSTARARRTVTLAVAILGALCILLLAPLTPEFTMPARATAATFALVAVLWVGNAMPAFAAGLLGVGLLVASLSLARTLPAAPGVPDAIGAAGRGVIVPWQDFAAQFASAPVVMTLAGMMLAAAGARTGMDRLVAVRLLAPFVGRVPLFLAIVLGIGAGLSMFMSNTATAVVLLTVLSPMVTPLGRDAGTARAVVLAAAVGATVGGVATPVGTSANVIALELLGDAGHRITFGRWMLFGLPVAVAVLALAWWLLRRIAVAGGATARPLVRPQDPGRLGVRGIAFALIFLATVVLWVTSGWTGVPIGVASMLPIALLPALRLVDQHDVRGMDWPTLLLMGSGLCLGIAMERTGLAAFVVRHVVPESTWLPALLLSFGVVSVVLSTFISSTAVTNLLIPLVVALGRPEAVVPCGMAVAFAASMAMALPVSTPPITIACSTGLVRPRELLGVGWKLGAAGLAAAMLLLAVGG